MLTPCSVLSLSPVSAPCNIPTIPRLHGGCQGSQFSAEIKSVAATAPFPSNPFPIVHLSTVELETNLFTITEKAPTRATQYHIYLFSIVSY